MDSPAISRSGRVLKKSAKVKEMEDIDINDIEAQGKSRKKSKGLDDFEEFDDKKIAPIKIPKISLNVSPTYSATSPKKKLGEGMHMMSKVPPFPSPVKSKFDPNRPIFQESSPEGKGSSSSETSSTTTTSSSEDESDIEINQGRQQRMVSMPKSSSQNIHHLPTPQEKVIVESYRQFNSPLTFVDQNSELAMFGSEEETSESNLVIAEESSDSRELMMKDRKGSATKKKPVRKTSNTKAAPTASKARVQKKKPPPKDAKAPARKKPEGNKEKKITAYMLWCSENRKRIVSQNPVLFSSISKKMGDIWQALPEKEKMAWRRKAKKLAQKGSSLISTGRPVDQVPKPISSPLATEDALRTSLESIKSARTSPIDVAAYLKLLGESLSIIGQRLTEHEGQIAVSGIFSVLLDSTLCALGPLLCLTPEIESLNGCSQSTLSKTLDNIAYFMPGL